MKCRTLGLIVTLTLAILWVPLISNAQRRATVPRIGYLAGTGSSAQQHLLTAFLQEMRDLGWVEGESYIIEFRYAEGQIE
jgi:putative tryptophan/tyrosine transport system substrate-binding protein